MVAQLLEDLAQERNHSWRPRAGPPRPARSPTSPCSPSVRLRNRSRTLQLNSFQEVSARSSRPCPRERPLCSRRPHAGDGAEQALPSGRRRGHPRATGAPGPAWRGREDPGEPSALSTRLGRRLLKRVLGVSVAEMGSLRSRDGGLCEEQVEIPKGVDGG